MQSPLNPLSPSAAAASSETPLLVTPPPIGSLNGRSFWQVFQPHSLYQERWNAWDRKGPNVSYKDWKGSGLDLLHQMKGTDINGLPISLLLVLFRCTIKLANNPLECIDAFMPSLQAREWKEATEIAHIILFIESFRPLPQELQLSETIQRHSDWLGRKWGDLNGINAESKYIN